MSDSAAWYAVWTRSHYERQVARQLLGKGFEAFLPEMSVWSTREGVSRPIRVPMFSGYLFVRNAMDKRAYVEMMKVAGLIRVLEDGWQRLTPVPDSEIGALQRVVDVDGPIRPHAHLLTGERVRVVSGPFADIEGFFVRDKPHQGRLVVSVGLLGRSVSVEVDTAHVRPS